MAGSSIFVIYSNGKGNVTLSARQGVGEVQPQHDTRANVTLLEGSGIQGGRMVANVLCTNCDQWTGGSTDFTSSGGDWIHASKPGEPLESTDVDENIEQHNNHGAFTWTYTSAQGGSSDVNPFFTDGSKNRISSPPQVSGPDNSDSSDESGQASNKMITAHGTLASVIFLVLFPMGAMVVRLLNLPVWFHAGVQIFSYCCYIAAAGLGIYIAKTQDQLSNHHPIIGMVLLAILSIQPLFGLLHHSYYKKLQKRTVTSHFHIWDGRIAIILGMINGGLGIQLAGGVSTGYKVAYGVVAGVVGTAYLASIVFGETRRRKAKSEGGSKERE